MEVRIESEGDIQPIKDVAKKVKNKTDICRLMQSREKKSRDE